jgi:hypothetical protein
MLIFFDQVPKLSGFLLMSIFPQIPLIIYVSYAQTISLPLDAIIGSLMIIVLVRSLVYETVFILLKVCIGSIRFLNSFEDYRLAKL